METTLEQKFKLYTDLYYLDCMVTKNEIKDKADTSRICMLDLHRMDGLTPEQFDEVELLANKYLNNNIK